MSNLDASEENLHVESGNISVSPGALIREAREASGVHIDVLAAALKITVDRLEALEADRYAALPDMVFARALASSACRILKIDSTSVLALMPKNQGQPLPVGRARISESIHEENQSRSLFKRQLTRPIGVAVMVLLVGATVLFFLPERGDSPETTNDVPKPALNSFESDENQPMPVASIAQNIENPAIDLVPSVLSKTADVKSLGFTNGESVPMTDSTISTNDLLEFHAREATWVQVRDATKSVVFERILAKGASATAAGALPLYVVVGKADALDVFVRGKPFALSALAKENVARFEVK